MAKRLITANFDRAHFSAGSLEGALQTAARRFAALLSVWINAACSFIEGPRQALVFELLLEARPDEFVALTFALGLESVPILYDLQQHRQRPHPAALLHAVDPTHVNHGVIDHGALPSAMDSTGVRRGHAEGTSGCDGGAGSTALVPRLAADGDTG